MTSRQGKVNTECIFFIRASSGRSLSRGMDRDISPSKLIKGRQGTGAHLQGKRTNHKQRIETGRWKKKPNKQGTFS